MYVWHCKYVCGHAVTFEAAHCICCQADAVRKFIKYFQSLTADTTSELVCAAYGYPVPSIIWSRGGSTLISLQSTRSWWLKVGWLFLQSMRYIMQWVMLCSSYTCNAFNLGHSQRQSDSELYVDFNHLHGIRRSHNINCAVTVSDLCRQLVQTILTNHWIG